MAKTTEDGGEEVIVAADQMDQPPEGEELTPTNNGIVTGFDDRAVPSFDDGNVQAGTPSSAPAPEGTRAKKLLTNFLKLSGYRAGDVTGSNEDRRTFVTSNGGKYQLSPKGTQLKVLSGPLPPKAEEE